MGVMLAGVVALFACSRGYEVGFQEVNDTD
jgi:hypothetical protein